MIPRALAATALLIAGLVPLLGCGEGERDLPPPDAVYSVRGEIVATPAPGNRSLLVRHESIPGFVSRAGEPEGMDSMTMPFTVARDLSLEDMEASDRIDFDFEVRWETEPILRIVRIDELPADTELDFSPLPEPEAAAPGEPGDAVGPDTEGE